MFKSIGVLLVMAAGVLTVHAAKTLDIYFIDVEGGQSTLIVTPAGQSLLVDTGHAAGGRDARRIAAAVRNAGLDRIDFLLTTHFHSDHDGGVVDLAKQIRIDTFIDHGTVSVEAEAGARGTLEAFKAYAAVRARSRHLEPKPGDRLPLNEVEAFVVSSAGKTIVQPLNGSAKRNTACASSEVPAQDIYENTRSTGFVLQFGKFRFLDIGDLTGKPLFALVCPEDVVGPVDVYLVAHHGGADAADPATFEAFRPRVAVLNNGAKKGGAAVMFTLLHTLAGADVWQLHRSGNPGAQNFADERIANLNQTTDHWIKVTASADGSFRVTNRRTGATKNYPAR